MAPQVDQNIDHFKITVPMYIYNDSLYLFTDIDNKIYIKWPLCVVVSEDGIMIPIYELWLHSLYMHLHVPESLLN